MNFGVGKDLITPDVKTFMGGYGSLYGKTFTGIHDDIFVKALLIDDGESKIVLISLDLLFHDYALTETISGYIFEKYGIADDNIIVSYTHSHAGPAIRGYDPGSFSEHYESFLLERIKSCIDRMFVNIFDGEAFFGTVQGDWNMNRRREVDGEICNAPNPGGPKDDDLDILTIRDREGVRRILMLNYSCHPVTLGETLWISGEYPGRLCQLLESRFFGCTSIFFQGAGANSRPRVAADGEKWKRCSFEELDGMATEMADSVQEAVCSGQLERLELDLAAKHFVVRLETEVYPKKFFEEYASGAKRKSQPLRHDAQIVLDNYDTSDNAVDLNAAIVRLNKDLYIGFLCGEVCFEVKQHICKAFGGRKVIFIGYGDASAYIPDDKILEEGGYEADGSSVVEYCLKGRFKHGIDKKIVDAFSENLHGF